MTGTSPTVASVLGPYVVTQIEAITENERSVLERDPDAIHDMRVATRRLKSVLLAYRSAFDREARRHLRTELDWLTETLGHARDHDIQRLILRGIVDDRGAAQVEAADLVMGEDAQADLLAALSSERYRALLEDLDGLRTHPAWTKAAHRPARKVLVKALTKQFARVDSRMADVHPLISTSKLDHRLHRVRKSVKRARYASEAAEPLLSSEGMRLPKRLSEVQDALGAHNDLVVASGRLTTWSEHGVEALGRHAGKTLERQMRASRRQARESLKTLHEIVAGTQPTLDVTLLR